MANKNPADTPEKAVNAKRVPLLVWIAAGAVLFAAGILVGRLTMSGQSPAPTASQNTQQAEVKPDDVVATYTYNDVTRQLSAKEVLEHSGLLYDSESSGDPDETLSADDIISCARAQIILQAADEQNIKVSDDELAAYAKNAFGTDDFASIAAVNKTSEQNVRQIVGDAARIEALRSKVEKNTSEFLPQGAEYNSKGAWQAYTNSLLHKANITINTLAEGNL